MPTAIPAKIEKCKGAMLATAIGDALGWPNEPRANNKKKNSEINGNFVEWIRRCRNPRYHDEKILPGEYSDDTQLTLSVARSIIGGDWERFLVEKEFPYWLKYQRGGGSAILKAAKCISEKKCLPWQSNYAQEYFNAGGNGSVMRILPHVIASAKKSDVSSLILDVTADTQITHGHPRAFLGAACYAYALDWLLRKENILEYGELISAVLNGQSVWGRFPNSKLSGNWLENANKYCGFDYLHEWDIVLDGMIKQLEFIKSSLKKGLMLDDAVVMAQLGCFSKISGAGDVTILASIYLASRYANNPILGIKIPAFSFGADTDTIASITGGLLGMLSGTNWIPAEWKNVQDYECLMHITDLLFFDNKLETVKAEIAKVKSQDIGWVQSPIGAIRFINSKQAPNGKNGFVVISKWQTVLGQTFYTKEFSSCQQTSQYEDQLQLEIQTQPITNKSETSQIDNQSAYAINHSQKLSEAQSFQQQFTITSNEIKTLLENPQFKNNTTIGKVFHVILAIIDNNESVSNIAKRLKVDEGLVYLIKRYIK